MKPYIAVTLTAWLGLAVILGTSGAFVSPMGSTPVRIVIGVAAPLLVFGIKPG